MKQKLLFLLVLLLTATTGAWAQSSLTCAEVYDKSKGTELALNDVVVTYVNNKYVYVKDATGYMLLYLTDSSGWTPGTILSNVTGTVDLYYGLHEVKLTSDQLMEVKTTTGDAPAPIEFTTAPVADDMNKYVVFKGVTVSNATFPSDKNMNVTIGEKTFVLRNQFNADVTFYTEKKYDITAVVSYYNTTVQAYFISATEASSSTPEPATYAVTFADDTAEPTLWNASPNADVKKGQTVTVTYTGTKKVIGVKAEKKAPAVTVTWNYDDITGTGKSFTKDGVTITAGNIDFSQKNFMQGGTFTTTLGNFTKIEVSGGNCTASGEGWSGDNTKKTWTGNASSVSFSGKIHGNGEGTLKFVFTIEPTN